MVRVLLARGADPNIKVNGGYPPVYGAMIRDHPSVVKLLMKNGVNLQIRNDAGETLLHIAGVQGFLGGRTSCGSSFSVD